MVSNGLIAVICVEVAIFIFCILIGLVAFLYYRRKSKDKNKSTLRPWPYVLPLYWYLSYYDSMVDKLFRTEPRLKMYQGTPEPPEKIRPIVELFVELEKELQTSMFSDKEHVDQAMEKKPNYPEKVSQLYNLDEMRRHYRELKELHTALDSKPDSLQKHVNKEITESEQIFTCTPDDEKARNSAKGTVLLKEIELYLEALFSEDIGESAGNRILEQSDVLAQTERRSSCTEEATLTEEFEVERQNSSEKTRARDMKGKKCRDNSRKHTYKNKFSRTINYVARCKTLNGFTESSKVIPITRRKAVI